MALVPPSRSQFNRSTSQLARLDRRETFSELEVELGLGVEDGAEVELGLGVEDGAGGGMICWKFSMVLEEVAPGREDRC